jgi:membrane fusion protein, multidrug efflux system
MKISTESNRFKILILLMIVLLTVGAGYFWWTKGLVSTDDAYVDGRIFTLTPRVAGYVTQIGVEDNQQVTKGQTLVTLDPTEYEVALAEAKANIAEAEFTLASLELGVPLELCQTEQRVKGAQAELATLNNNLAVRQKEEEAAVQDVNRYTAEREKASIDLQRMTGLRKSSSVSQSSLDDAETRFASAAAQVGAAQARVQGAQNQIAALKSDMSRLVANVKLAETGEDQARIRARQVEAQKARVDLARTRVKQAELNLGYTVITSPTDGYVTRKKIEPGVMVSRGQLLFAVVPLTPEDTWVTANYKETQLTRVKAGQRATIEVDTFPGMKLTGIVDSIMSGTGAVFSLFPPENATGNFVKVVQRIPVKIRIDNNSMGRLPVLRMGMSVISTIDTLK